MKLFRKKSIDPNSGPGWSAYVESAEDFDEAAWQEEIQRQIGEMTSGNGNIFLGANSGNNLYFQNTSNKLIIANSETSTPLIYGEFDNELLKINGKLIIQKNNGVPIYPYSNGIQGQLAFDNEYFYICVQNNIWKRFLLSTW